MVPPLLPFETFLAASSTQFPPYSITRSFPFARHPQVLTSISACIAWLTTDASSIRLILNKGTLPITCIPPQETAVHVIMFPGYPTWSCWFRVEGRYSLAHVLRGQFHVKGKLAQPYQSSSNQS